MPRTRVEPAASTAPLVRASSRRRSGVSFGARIAWLVLVGLASAPVGARVAAAADTTSVAERGRAFAPCLEAYPLRLHTAGATIEPISATSTPEGIRYVLARPDRAPKDANGLVSWYELAGVDTRQSRRGPLASGFQRGALVGLAVGVVSMLAATDPPKGSRSVLYPFTVGLVALPLAGVGGWIGGSFDDHSQALPGETGRWVPCPTPEAPPSSTASSPGVSP